MRAWCARGVNSERASRRPRGPSAATRITIGTAVFFASILIVVAGVILFAGELAPGGQQESMVIMALWFFTVVAVGFVIQRRFRFLRWPLAAGVLGTIVAVTGVLAVSQFTDQVVNEDVAVVGETAAQTNSEGDPEAAEDPAALAPDPGAPVNVEIATGSFSALAHPAVGNATAIELAEGGRVLTLTDFETDNGPDLRVYLVSGEVNSNGDGDDFVDLGALKGNIGDQQYEIPAGVDLTEFNSVVIWCRAFSSGFGVAELSAATTAGPA